MTREIPQPQPEPSQVPKQAESIWDNPFAFITPLCHDNRPRARSPFPEINTPEEEAAFNESIRSIYESMGFEAPKVTDQEHSDWMAKLDKDSGERLISETIDRL